MPAWARCPLLSFLLMIAAGWIHRHQLIVIDFLQTENRLLKERLRGRRIRFTDAERALWSAIIRAAGASESSAFAQSCRCIDEGYQHAVIAAPAQHQCAASSRTGYRSA